MDYISHNEAFDRLLDELESLATQRSAPGVSDPADIAALCIASIAGGPDLTIIYQDQDGVTSVRHITVHAIERCLNGATCVRAYDRDREAPRSFRLERIRAAATERREVAAVEWVA